MSPRTYKQSPAYDTAVLRTAALSSSEVQSYRDSCVGNPFVRRLMDTGTGFLEPAPKGHRWDLGSIFFQFDTDGDGYLDMGEVGGLQTALLRAR